MSAKLASKTKFFMDFKPLTFGPFLKKTLYEPKYRKEILKKMVNLLLSNYKVIIDNFCGK